MLRRKKSLPRCTFCLWDEFYATSNNVSVLNKRISISDFVMLHALILPSRKLQHCLNVLPVFPISKMQHIFTSELFVLLECQYFKSILVEYICNSIVAMSRTLYWKRYTHEWWDNFLASDSWTNFTNQIGVGHKHTRLEPKNSNLTIRRREQGVKSLSAKWND